MQLGSDVNPALKAQSSALGEFVGLGEELQGEIAVVVDYQKSPDAILLKVRITL